jgi:hypothetical protein
MKKHHRTAFDRIPVDRPGATDGEMARRIAEFLAEYGYRTGRLDQQSREEWRARFDSPGSSKGYGARDEFDEWLIWQYRFIRRTLRKDFSHREGLRGEINNLPYPWRLKTGWVVVAYIACLLPAVAVLLEEAGLVFRILAIPVSLLLLLVFAKKQIKVQTTLFNGLSRIGERLSLNR